MGHPLGNVSRRDIYQPKVRPNTCVPKFGDLALALVMIVEFDYRPVDQITTSAALSGKSISFCWGRMNLRAQHWHDYEVVHSV